MCIDPPTDPHHRMHETPTQVTAQDNLRTVQAFFDRFPHLRANDFYLASESYGGCVHGHGHVRVTMRRSDGRTSPGRFGGVRFRLS